MEDKNLTRRNFIYTLAAIPVGAALLDTRVQAADMPHLDESDPAAKALSYVSDATKLDKSNPLAANYKAGDKCLNCAQLQGEAGPQWRPCAIFPGKLVHVDGWCSAYTSKS